jgi:hypothetical protein
MMIQDMHYNWTEDDIIYFEKETTVTTMKALSFTQATARALIVSMLKQLDIGLVNGKKFLDQLRKLTALLPKLTVIEIAMLKTALARIYTATKQLHKALCAAKISTSSYDTLMYLFAIQGSLVKVKAHWL